MINTVTLVSPTLRIRVSCGDVTMVRLEGELDTACTDLVATAARLVPTNATLVSVDLRDLTFIDSAGVDALAALQALRGVLMANARAQVERVIGFLGISTWLSEPSSAPTLGYDSPATPVSGSNLGHPPAQRPAGCSSTPLLTQASVSS
jgi:anti-anti-sigma factor